VRTVFISKRAVNPLTSRHDRSELVSSRHALLAHPLNCPEVILQPGTLQLGLAIRNPGPEFLKGLGRPAVDRNTLAVIRYQLWLGQGLVTHTTCQPSKQTSHQDGAASQPQVRLRRSLQQRRRRTCLTCRLRRQGHLPRYAPWLSRHTIGFGLPSSVTFLVQMSRPWQYLLRVMPKMQCKHVCECAMLICVQWSWSWGRQHPAI
jgi:hypothetical protein